VIAFLHPLFFNNRHCPSDSRTIMRLFPLFITLLSAIQTLAHAVLRGDSHHKHRLSVRNPAGPFEHNTGPERGPELHSGRASPSSEYPELHEDIRKLAASPPIWPSWKPGRKITTGKKGDRTSVVEEISPVGEVSDGRVIGKIVTMYLSENDLPHVLQAFIEQNGRGFWKHAVLTYGRDSRLEEIQTYRRGEDGHRDTIEGRWKLEPSDGGEFPFGLNLVPREALTFRQSVINAIEDRDARVRIGLPPEAPSGSDDIVPKYIQSIYKYDWRDGGPPFPDSEQNMRRDKIRRDPAGGETRRPRKTKRSGALSGITPEGPGDTAAAKLETQRSQFQAYLSAFESAQATVRAAVFPFVAAMVKGSNSSLMWLAAWSAYTDLTHSNNVIFSPVMYGMNCFGSLEDGVLANDTTWGANRNKTFDGNGARATNATNGTMSAHDHAVMEYLAAHQAVLNSYNFAWTEGTKAANRTGALQDMLTLSKYLLPDDERIWTPGFDKKGPVDDPNTKFFTQFFERKTGKPAS